MPRPPPPAAALIRTGKPISSAAARASSSVVSAPAEPGTTGMPAFITACLAVILSPIIWMCSGLGPMKVKPWAPTMSANRAFSDRKP